LAEQGKKRKEGRRSREEGKRGAEQAIKRSGEVKGLKRV
jgi:hypothetical protein